MSEITKNGQGFVGYEYKDVTVKRGIANIYADSYQNFGWKLEGSSTPIQSVGSVTLKFKRDRKIRNKAELSRLQRQFDACANEIEQLEFPKTVKASAIAYAIGLIGTAFMAGSVFSIITENPNVLLSVILAIPAFAGWIIPYWCYRSISAKKTNAVAPLIDRKYDEIYDVCEKASGLVN
jgi:hypothetical protein